MIRTIGLILIVSGLKNVQQAYVSRNMLFKRFFWSTLGGTIASAFVGIFLAYRGVCAWALIGQQMSNTLIDTTILWITVKWYPIKSFSWVKFGRLFSYGWKLLISGLLNTVYNNLRNLIIGKKYTEQDLGYYNNGQKIPSLVVANLNVTIGSVLFPALSKEQDQKELMCAHVRRSIQISFYVLWPIMLGVAVCAEPLATLLLTEKWLPAVPYLQMACIVYGMMPIHTANLQAINAMGRSDIFLKLEVVKKTEGIIFLLISIPYGVPAIAFSAIVTGIVSTFINAWPNRKLLGYSGWNQMKDVLPSFLLALVMGLSVMQINRLEMSPVRMLCIQIPMGIGIYILGSVICKMECFRYICLNLKPLGNRFKKIK